MKRRNPKRTVVWMAKWKGTGKPLLWTCAYSRSGVYRLAEGVVWLPTIEVARYELREIKKKGSRRV